MVNVEAGRNNQCPCGSGKKYKKCCHGKQVVVEPGRDKITLLVALFNQQRYADAELAARHMTDNFPRFGFGWKVLGAACNQLGMSADALASLQKAAAMLPDDEEVSYNLGSTLHKLGRLTDAAVSYRRALQIKPDYVEAHNNLGNILKDLGHLMDAEASYRHALQIKPHYAEAHVNLGNTLKELGQMMDAEASYRKALQIRPDFVEALNSLALLLNARAEPVMALNLVSHSMRINETAEAKSIFVACVKRLHVTQYDSMLHAAMVRALTEPWGRPAELVRTGMELVKYNPDIGECVARAVDAWPVRLAAQDLFGINGLAALENDALLCALLDAEPLCDMAMERFLSMARHAMLVAAASASAAPSGFHSALARQCFINEYVYAYTDEEFDKACELRDSLVAALEAKAPIPACWPVAVACYFPLCSLPCANRLLELQWPDAMAALLKQQISEPEQERQIRATLPRLTGIEDEVSLLVQHQYEENPYPRWFRADPAGQAMNLAGYLRRKFPQANFKYSGKKGRIDILVAGCGTGQHSIGTAQRIQGAQVLAIDLSISSLAYARRKSMELGLTSIEYAQADLLKLDKTARNFDVIESVGVLHHLADPWVGWQKLLSLLRPGGFMELGFYSELARRDMARVAEFIAERGYGSSADEIRRFRQDLLDSEENAGVAAALNSADFYGISTCRDLLFHVREQCMTLCSIAEFLREHKLALLGFEIGDEVLNAYRLRFPDDSPAANLENWQIFESENPDTFGAMYQFWVQK